MVYVEILIVAVLIVVNGLLAMSELAIVSSRPARLKTMADRGIKGANAPSASPPIPANSCRPYRSASRSSASSPAPSPARRLASG